MVVEPYNKEYTSDKTATLMADQALRTEYENLARSIQEKADKALVALRQASGLRRGEVEELGRAFGLEGDIYTLLEHVHSTVTASPDPGLAEIKYAEIFNGQVRPFLETPAVRSQLDEYVKCYERLVSNSVYFRAGGFNHNHAATVRKALADASFFAANHTISLADRHAATKTEITSAAALDRAIEQEKQRIFSDNDLTRKFEEIDGLITKNADLRQFRTFLQGHMDLIPQLADLGALQRNLWLSYAHKAKDPLAEFVTTYHTGKTEIARVVAQAAAQQTEWKRVLEIFHRRFSVPFLLEVANQPDVVLKSQAPSLVFNIRKGQRRLRSGRATCSTS